MYDMPFTPSSDEEMGHAKLIRHLEDVVTTLEMRVETLTEQVEYLDSMVHQLSEETALEELEDGYQIPAGRLPC